MALVQEKLAENPNENCPILILAYRIRLPSQYYPWFKNYNFFVIDATEL
jgi:hypothetical protein